MEQNIQSTYFLNSSHLNAVLTEEEWKINTSEKPWLSRKLFS